jgi:hypothetical protein
MVTEHSPETAVASGEVEAANAPKYRRKGTGIDNNAGEAGSNAIAAQHGLTLETEIRTEAGFVDPSIVQIIYHAYDGRQHPVPAYMVPKLLSHRFPSGDAFIPRGQWGKQVWFTRSTNVFVPGEVICLLHEDADPAVKAELKAIGITSSRCRKQGIASEFHLNDHMRLKHKQELRMLTEYRGKQDRLKTESLQTAQLDALLKLAEAASKR